MTVDVVEEAMAPDPLMQAIDALVDLMDEITEKSIDADWGPPVLLPQNEISYESKNTLEDLPPPDLDLEVKLEEDLEEPVFKKLYVRLIKEELVPRNVIPLKDLKVRIKQEEIQAKKLVVKLTRINEKEMARLLKKSSKPKEKPPPQKIVCRIPKTLLPDKFWDGLLSPKKPVQTCFVCKKELETGESLNLHLYRYHPVQLKIRIRCPKCSFRTSSKHKFLSHMKRRHARRDESHRPLFYCKFCSFKSKYQDVVKDHQRNRECKRYKCGICGLVVGHIESLRAHEKIHAGDLQIKCPHTSCTYKAKNKYCLDAHLRRHNKKSMPCKICQKVVDLRFMASHVMSHSISKKDMLLRCDKCNYRTLYDANYKRHLLTHKADVDKKYKKCPDCDYKTTDSGNLKRHFLYSHSSDFRWRCELCDFATNHHNSWNHHKEQHKSYSEREKLKCPECSNKYLTRRGLDLHIITAHKKENEVKTYKCKYCGYTSRIKQTFKIHLRTKHELGPTRKRAEVFYCLGCRFKSKTEDRMEAHILEHQKRNESCDYEVREK